MPGHGAQISNRFLIHLDRIIIERGGDLLGMMRHADLPYELLVAEDLKIPFEKHMRILAVAQEELKLYPLGLVLATRQFIAHLRPLFDLMLSQHSLEGSLLAFNENMQTVVEGLQGEVVSRGDLASLILTTDLNYLNSSSIFHDHAAGLMAQLARWLVGKDFKLASVSIPHPEPKDLTRYRSFFGCPVNFDQGRVAINFHRSYLDKPLPQSAKSLIKEYNQVLEWDRNASLLAQVRSAIRRNVGSSHCNLDYISKSIGLSARTLQRRLSERGTNFHRQLDSVRAGLSRRYLYENDFDMAQIAAMLGYADQACFTRGFQRWYGRPPVEWRKILNAQRALSSAP